MEGYVINDAPEPDKYNTPDGVVTAEEMRRRKDEENNKGSIRDAKHV